MPRTPCGSGIPSLGEARRKAGLLVVGWRRKQEWEVCVLFGGLGALAWICGQGAADLEAPCQLQRTHPALAGSYVEGMVHLHYKTDEAVKGDLELQTWCREITDIRLLGAQDRGKTSPWHDMTPPAQESPP